MGNVQITRETIGAPGIVRSVGIDLYHDDEANRIVLTIEPTTTELADEIFASIAEALRSGDFRIGSLAIVVPRSAIHEEAS